MKHLLLLSCLISLPLFAQTSEELQKEFRFLADTIVESPVKCLETRAELDNSNQGAYVDREVKYDLEIEEGYDYENEFFIHFNNPASSFKAFVAYEDFNGSPMGKVEVVKDDGVTKEYRHTFYGFTPSYTSIVTKNNRPIELIYKAVSGYYVVQKVSCSL